MNAFFRARKAYAGYFGDESVALFIEESGVFVAVHGGRGRRHRDQDPRFAPDPNDPNLVSSNRTDNSRAAERASSE